MKQFFVTFVMLMIAICGNAQVPAGNSKITTVYNDFMPALVVKTSGDTIKMKANIFLKNASLVYKSGVFTMEADLQDIKEVIFADRHYVAVDSMLATVIDTVKGNQLLEATVIDVQAWIGKMKNAQMVSNLQMFTGDNVTVNRIDLSTEEDRLYPLVKRYIYRYEGKYILVKDRILSREIPKEKRSVLRTITHSDEFDWSDEKWLVRLLRYISR